MALGIIGEYIARMFVEVKQRPLYLVERHRAASRPIAPTGSDSPTVSAEPWRSH